MRTPTLLLACACLVGVLTGCGEGAGYLIKPVPLDQTLRETVVQRDPGWVTDKIALVDVGGLLLNERSGMPWSDGENPVSLLEEKLQAAARDRNVKAVVLRINSPGGTVQASAAMRGLVDRFRKDTGKPVVTCITDVGASGAYYLACAGDPIVCQPTSIVGSIGVIIQTISFAGTMKMVGVTSDAVVSGPMKDMGSPLRDMRQEERKVFQAMVDEFFDGFVDAVARGRPKLDKEKVRALADGRVYTGARALEAGLVDKLGDVSEAVTQAKQAASVQKAKVVMYHRPLGYRANTYSAAPTGTPAAGTQINLLNVQGGELLLLRRPVFLYLWSSDLPR